VPARDGDRSAADDVVRGWAPVYAHLRYRRPAEAIEWLVRAFGLRERVRMARLDGSVVIAKLEGPAGGLVMVAGDSPELRAWLRERTPGYREAAEPPWPDPSHTITVMVGDVDAHHEHAKSQGATILMPPTDHPWGLRAYASLDLEGHQWEFARVVELLEPERWGAKRID
jgi:uncharacterized glyoxalase superfamily protein PhnB